MMQKARHIVNLIEPPHDPLATRFEGIEPHGLAGWILIEYLEK